MALKTKYFVHTEADGVLGDSTEADVRAAVDAIVAKGQGVLHFHGGLVNKDKGMEIAESLQVDYESAGAHPVFFVWEAGLIETITGNLGEIFREDIFEALLKKLLKWVVGDITTPEGAKAIGGLQFPGDLRVSDELSKRSAAVAEEPFGDVETPLDFGELAEADRRTFEQELSTSPEFDAAARAVASAALGTELVDATSRGIATKVHKSSKTLMSPDVVDELVTDSGGGAKGIGTTAKLVVRGGKVLASVVKRLRSGHGHGAYTTSVEEILREFYLANVGAEIWLMMKNDTSDTFKDDPGDRRGGELFLDLIGEKAKVGGSVPIDLIGHSTGAIFICNLLAATDQAAADPAHPLPADFRFRNVALLAPACGHHLLAETLASHRSRFEQLRMYAMNDEREAQDRLLPGPLAAFYPRSLLYFVSGVVERTPDGGSASDLPLVGMERYLTNDEVYNSDAVNSVRDFLAEPKRAVFAPAIGEPGLECDASDHGDLDNDPATVASLKHLIEHGY